MENIDNNIQLWWQTLESIALNLLGDEKTGCIQLIINQGGLQNRYVPRELKDQFRQIWRGKPTTRIECHVAERKLKVFNHY